MKDEIKVGNLTIKIDTENDCDGCQDNINLIKEELPEGEELILRISGKAHFKSVRE
jgi:hypothetical protein